MTRLILFGLAACTGTPSAVDSGPRSPGSLRLANLEASARGACIGLDESPTWSRQEVPARQATAPVAVEGTAARVRWIEPAAECDAPGVPEIAVDFVESPSWVVAARHAGAIAFEEPTAEVVEGRFFVGFFHGAEDLGDVSVKQGSCDVPFAAFERVAPGTVGLSPNNDGPLFSAAVTAGSDRFVTDVVICTVPAGDEVLRIAEHTFVGGVRELHLLSGDGSAEHPYGLTRCREPAPPDAPCDLLIPVAPP
ncbi:MAG: hypothetical protein AAF602_08855 [Myxococcota bacterium]